MRKTWQKYVTGSLLILFMVISLACQLKKSQHFSIPEGGTWSGDAWIDTGIQIRRGQTIEISATGSVRPSSGSDVSAGPDGTTEVQIWQDSYSFRSDYPHEAVIVQIGEGDILLIGSGAQFEAQTAGTLMLGVNDSDPGNNVGCFEVEINY